MYRIQKEHIHELVIQKSRFICYLVRIESEQDYKDYVKQVKKLHPKANHHCQAFILNKDIQRSSDDGEPSLTAGLPMLEVLRKQNMEKIGAVVVRYFGGILLGTGGLVRAYSKSVSEALENAQLFHRILIKKYRLSFSYEYINRIEFTLKETTILDKVYDEKVIYTYISNEDSLIKTITEITNGKFIPEFIIEEEIEEKV